MKILYAIQGTGNGHITRAKELIPYFQKHGEVDILISGIHKEIELPYPVKYHFKGLGFVFGKSGGIDVVKTFLKNHIQKFVGEIRSVPVENYDLIISDFEPISAWASHFKGRHCVALSNQCALRHRNDLKPKKEDLLGKFIINHYAPCNAEYGFSYFPNKPQHYTPIIRKEIRELKVSIGNHYTVYLPAYSDKKIKKVLASFEEVEWQVFSKNSTKIRVEDNITFYPISEKVFINSLASCIGVLCASGFGATSEALFLKKKLLVVPQKNQYEQQCNAEQLKKMGISVLKKLSKKHHSKIENWILNAETIEVNYLDQTELIVDTIVYNEFLRKDNYQEYITKTQFA